MVQAKVMKGEVLYHRYRLGEKVGQGAMAEVFKAWDLQYERWVALKVLRPQVAEDKDLRRRFLLEGSIQAELEHPHVLKGYGAHQEGEFFLQNPTAFHKAAFV